MNRRDLFKLAGAVALAPYLPLGNCFVGYRAGDIDLNLGGEKFASEAAANTAGCHTVAEFGPEAWNRLSREGLACITLFCSRQSNVTITAAVDSIACNTSAITSLLRR